MKLEYETMGQRVAERRRHLKIKQHQLAEQPGISNNHLSSIERDKERTGLVFS
jgi:transcriptional regulator with XRE-family HTH domain